MPRGKLKRKHSCNSQILGEKEVRKLQKLMNDDFGDGSNVTEVKPAKRSNESSESDSEEEEFDFSNLPEEPIDEEDEDSWKKFFGPNTNSKDLASEIQNNLKQCKMKISDDMSQFSGSAFGDSCGINDIQDFNELPEELRDHIRLLTDVLKHYRSGPLPKTVKMIPHLPGWEGLLELLKPLEWDPHAYPRVVKIFASKGHEPALHFYEHYLLPKVRQDIEENGRLCIHLFESLITAMFRPEEFISGLFLPWIQSDLTKIEGMVLSNLIKRATLKARFAAVALAFTFEEEFSIPRSMIIETLLSKRYHLPAAALAKTVLYFLSFDKDCSTYYTDEQRMPVTWFKSLLTFLEFYRHCLSPEERDLLLKLCRRHEHPQITPEIRSFLSLVSTK